MNQLLSDFLCKVMSIYPLISLSNDNAKCRTIVTRQVNVENKLIIEHDKKNCTRVLCNSNLQISIFLKFSHVRFNSLLFSSREETHNSELI